MKRIFLLTVIAVFGFVACCQPKEKKAKYVFYFIGDGMGFSHLSIAEAYQSYLDGEIGSKPLSFTQFPVMGMATTYSASNTITCSSAAGTALSTGFKTNNNFLGVAPDSTNLESISYKIHREGYKVGIMSTVSIDHATPASFYANAINRNMYYEIACQIPSTDFEFFGGGGFIDPLGKDFDKESAYDIIKKGGYSIAAGLDQFSSMKDSTDKILLLQNEGEKSHELKYSIDQKDGDMKLADVVSAAIDYLYNEDGFFIMAEGGQIDWAAHANDAKADILEVIDLSQAVAIAYRFYLEHPDETLIVVTADHETGGFAMGKHSGYMNYFNELDSITFSKESEPGKSEIIDDATAKAKLGWTTFSHTGSAVPVFAIGAGSSQFAGRMNNIDIPKKICSAMGIEF